MLFTPIEFDPTIPEKFKTWVDQLVDILCLIPLSLSLSLLSTLLFLYHSLLLCMYFEYFFFDFPNKLQMTKELQRTPSSMPMLSWIKLVYIPPLIFSLPFLFLLFSSPLLSLSPSLCSSRPHLSKRKTSSNVGERQRISTWLIHNRKHPQRSRESRLRYARLPVSSSSLPPSSLLSSSFSFSSHFFSSPLLLSSSFF